MNGVEVGVGFEVRFGFGFRVGIGFGVWIGVVISSNLLLIRLGWRLGVGVGLGLRLGLRFGLGQLGWFEFGLASIDFYNYYKCLEVEFVAGYDILYD